MNENKTEWFSVDRINDLDSPALLIYKDRVIENIQKAIELVGPVGRLRPHIKTHKTKEVSLLMKKAGITKYKCATIAEADILGMIQAPDVLLAYQPVGPKIKRFLSLMRDYSQTSFSCLVDNAEAAGAIAKEAENNYLQVRVYIDVNAGMNRTGCAPGQAKDLFLTCTTLKGLRPIGFHAYDGHLHNPHVDDRQELAEKGLSPILQAKKQLEAKGWHGLSIVAGGTPTFPIHARNKEVECSPGTFVYWDKGYGTLLPEQPFRHAALVLCRVISLPDRNLVCTDLGHKSIASENVLTKRVTFLNAPDLIPISHSEEHMVFRAPDGHPYKIGDVLYGLPEHICPTCALYERASVVHNGQVIDEWSIAARDRRLEH